MASIPGLELLEKDGWEIVGFDYVSQDEHFVEEHGHIARWIGKSKSSHKRLIIRKIRNPEPPKQCVASGPVSLGPETIQAIAKAVAVELRLNWADRMVEPVKNVPLAEGLVGVWVPSNNPTASPRGTEPPAGYRWLKFEEKLVSGDSWVKSSGKIQPIDEGTVNHFVAIDKFFIRKVEEPQPKQPWTPKIGERVVLKATGAIYRVGSYNDNSKQYSMEGWPGSCVNLENIAPWFENEEQPKRYREPTLADLANGPIECEARNSNDEPWKARRLLAIDKSRSGIFLFLCRNEPCGETIEWAQCRIEDK